MPVIGLPPALVLFGWYVMFWGAMAVSPADWTNWALSSVIPALVVGGLLAGRRVLALSTTSYLLLGAFVTLHTIGAHYTYARVPLGDWLSPVLGNGRNDYDRLVHFAFGLLLAGPIGDVLTRVSGVRGFMRYYLPVMTIAGLSSMWEILEAWVARIVSPELGAAYLGSQGDVWDAQNDMAAALCGALIWLLLRVWSERRSVRAAAESVGPVA
jgi:putative membrane protein